MQVGRALFPLSLAAAMVFPSAAVALSPTEGPAICQSSEGYAASFGGRRTFTLRPTDLEAIKAALPDDPAIAAAYRALIARADKALSKKRASVFD